MCALLTSLFFSINRYENYEYKVNKNITQLTAAHTTRVFILVFAIVATTARNRIKLSRTLCITLSADM